MSPMQTTSSVANTNNNFNNLNTNNKEQFLRCCYPSGDCLKLETSIPFDLNECVRVICNNENCFVGQYMHRECFDAWEQSILAAFKSIGRARCWSDRQRSQNLWTKKGYELVYKSCVCKCGRGHIRKDLEWPLVNVIKNIGNSHFSNGITSNNRLTNSMTNIENCNDDEEKKKKKKRNRNQKTVMVLSTLNTNAYHANSQQERSGSYNEGSDCAISVVGNNNNQNIANSINTNNSLTGNNSNNLVTNPKIGIIGSGLTHNNNQHQTLSHIQSQQNILASINNIINNNNCNANILGIDLCTRSDSITSNEESISPSASHCSDDFSVIQKSQQIQEQSVQQQCQKNLFQNDYPKTGSNDVDCVINLNNSSSISSAPVLLKQKAHQTLLQLSPETHAVNGADLMQANLVDQQQLVQQQKNKEVEIYSERVRSTSGCNGIFSRRLDFSSFNLLPKTRLNSYQVKIEDEGNHGNDETRLFILSSLAQSQMSRVSCILCEEPMLVFDRYPLVDGSFFLSPKQHSSNCIEVKYEGRALYLTCVCMSCLDGTSINRAISCRFCSEIWNGSNLVLGTMYAYDIFAAMPCCAERLKCNNCFKLLLHPQQRLNFYSDYSHSVTCPYCTTQDTHFVKPLGFCYTKHNIGRQQQIA